MATFLTKSQLKQLREISGKLEQLASEAHDLHNEVKEKFDNRSDKWRDESDAGSTATDDVDYLEKLADGLDDIVSNISNVDGFTE